jgi:HSP20 family protein
MISAHATGHHKFNAMTKMLQWVDQVLTPGSRKYCPDGSWTPAINLYEDDGYYYVVADIAGADVDQIELRAEAGILTLCGHRQTPQPPQTSGPVSLHLMEIDHGRFCRALELPPEVDVNEIRASYRSGYLWVRMPKKS